MEQYYGRNESRHRIVTRKELGEIEKVKESADAVELYEEVFKIA
jgi:hypothetical protein